MEKILNQEEIDRLFKSSNASAPVPVKSRPVRRSDATFASPASSGKTRCAR